jgi:hypothetical protein
LFTPAAVVRSAPSVSGIHEAECTFQLNAGVWFYVDTKRYQTDVKWDPKTHRVLERLKRFLRFFEPTHSVTRWMT